MKEAVVLIHSPLTGSLTWAPVSRQLRQRGVETVVPTLIDEGGSAQPYWAQHAGSVARRLEALSIDRPVILVAHSGSGPLLPAIAAFSPHPIAGVIFVDAGLPHPGQSRLQDIEAGVPELGAQLRQELEGGGSFPRWTDEDLRDIIPDDSLRQGALADLRPRGLAFFTEPLPSLTLEPGFPCGYVKFSEAYTGPAEHARQNGWAYREFDAGHFHMLVDPKAVADALLDAISQMGLGSKNRLPPSRRSGL